MQTSTLKDMRAGISARGRRRRFATFFGLTAAVLMAVGSSVAAAGAAAPQSSSPKHGGSVTALMNSLHWPSLDPINLSATAALTSSIYGDLFEPGPNRSIVDDLATGYTISKSHLVYNITIRPNVKFQDGTPFNAAAVVFNYNRDLNPANACANCLSLFPMVKSSVAVGKYDVRVTLTTPDAPFVGSIIDSSLNWIVSPTALASMGEAAFAQMPVGAGPFKVVSNSASAELVLTKNTSYWQKGHPYLNSLTFLSTASDQSDIAAIQSGQANLSWVQSVPLIEQAKSTPGLAVHAMPAATIRLVLLNEQQAPFNNILAREAVTYATDPAALDAALYTNLYPKITTFTGPGLLFYQKKVPGYKGYNLAKAESIVSELGGLTVQLIAKNNTPSYVLETEALAQEWNAAGIKTSVIINTLPQSQVEFVNGHWETMDSMYGSQPDPGIGLAANFGSLGQFSGTRDPSLDGLINQFNQFQSSGNRQKTYTTIENRLSSQYEFVPLYATPVEIVTGSNVEGLTATSSNVGFETYENVWLK